MVDAYISTTWHQCTVYWLTLHTGYNAWVSYCWGHLCCCPVSQMSGWALAMLTNCTSASDDSQTSSMSHHSSASRDNPAITFSDAVEVCLIPTVHKNRALYATVIVECSDAAILTTLFTCTLYSYVSYTAYAELCDVGKIIYNR